jgi:hypothetical protein
MSDDAAKERVLADTVIRALAVREMLAAMLAVLARESGESVSFLREFSDLLDKRLASQGVVDSLLMLHEVQIRSEWDRIISFAQTAYRAE